MNNNNNKYKQQQQQPAQLLVDLSTMGSVPPRSSRRVRREALRGWRSIVMSRTNSLFLMPVLSCSLDDHHIVITEVLGHSVCETWIRSRAGHNISLSAPGLNCVGDTTTQQPGLARLCLVTLLSSALLLPINRISVGSDVQMWVWWWS